VSRTRTTFTSAAALLLAVSFPASPQERSDNRIVRPEGYIELVGDGGAPAGKGSFSVVPADKKERKPAAQWDDASDEFQGSEEQVPPAPPPPTPREACRTQSERFARRRNALRGNSADGGEVLDDAVQRAMFGRTALRAPATDPDQPVPELTWDDELKDLYRAYQKCVKAARR
jgi:hypothetical protein